jgi:hypothetical protein
MRAGKTVAASRGIAAAALALAVLGLTAQAQVVVKTPKSPACSKMKDEAAARRLPRLSTPGAPRAVRPCRSHP